MANFSSRKDKKYNVDEIANQLIEQIKNNNVDSSKINVQRTTNNSNNSLWNTVKETANNNTSWFKKSEAYKDTKGNWITDTTATTLSTIGDIGTGLVKGVMNIGEGIGDLITYGRAQIKENKGNVQRANELRQSAKKDSVGSIFEPIQTKLDKNSVLGNKSDNIVEGLGYVAGVTAIGIATGGAATAATTATTFSSAMGQGMNQAYQEGASNDDAWKYGVISGLAEAGTELLFGGLGKASGAVGLSKSALPVDDMVAKKVSGVFKSCLGKNLSQYVIKSGAEGTEEVISGVIQALGQKLTYKSSEEIGKLIKDQNLLEQFITGTATSAIAQIPGNNGIYKTTKDGREFIPNSTESEIESNNTSNLQPQSTQNQQILLAQQSNQEENKVAQSGDVKQILPIQRYVYEKSDNVKVNNLRQDASKYWDNSEKTINYMNMLEKIIQDKNIDIRLDSNLRDSKGNVVNGSYSNGVITINPNSTRTGEFIAIHELTHAIGTEQMRNIVQKYRESNAEFDTAVKSLLQNYNTTELTEEAMSDVAGQLFGNQEFINNLAQTEPSLFQKIYNEIKYLWHQFTGYKNQDQFISDLQYKWEQAYRSNTRLNETTNYYIEPVEKFNEIEYNNVIEEKLSKREYAILRSIINSDSNIKPGINYVEVTNGRYTVYYKGFDDFKVMSRKVDADAGRINKRNDATGRKTRYSKTFEQSIGNEGTTASNDEISNFNTTGTCERSGSNTSSSTNIKNGINLPTQESENNSGSFNLNKINSILNIKDKYKDKTKYLILNENEKTININNMVVKEELRNKGIGQNILNDIINYANENNKTITLTPTSEFNTKDRLKKWYKKNGFVENKGKNMDFLISDTMYKLPSNSNKKYSLPTKEWQQYLDENYKPSGTRTNLEDIKLPNKQEKNIPVNEEKRVAQILEKPVQKVKEKDRTWAIIKANLIDKGMVFEELSRKAGNRDLQGKWDYTLTSTARGQNAIGNARYELDLNTKTQKQISKSLTDIIEEVGENTADFYSYMYHQLNIDRMTLEDRFGGDTGINYERKNEVKNKPVFGESVTAQMSREKVQELEKKYPEFKEYAQDVYNYLDANTKELVDNGVISKETQQLFKDMYPHYVPISRIDTKGISVNVPLDTGRTGINSPIKKATGGSSNINPLFETMADRTLQTYRASARNNFGVELKNTLNKIKQLNQETQQADLDTIMEQMTDEKQNNQLLQEGKKGENPTFTVFENGDKVTYEISKDMYEALKPKNELLSKIDDSKFSKIANKVNNFRRGLLTEYNPIFSITNAIKDSQDILLNSQHSAKTYSKIPEATAQILSKGYWYNEYIQNGGAQNSYFKDGEFEVTKNNLPTKIKNTITFPLRAISNVNNVIEMTPRLAEYIVSREQGRSIETSMLDASRVTTNFKAGGDITKTLNRNGFTFLNASVQGMQQQIRNIQEANAKGLKGYAVLACKYAIAGVPVLLLNNLIWADDEEYDELQDYVKDNYYIIGKLSNGKFLRIPKGRAVATIQKIVSNANEFVKNDTINSDEVGKIFWEDMKENIKFGIDNLAPNNPMENNILSPVIQAITNKTWYGEDLVPTRLQNKPKEEQYDESTDKFSRWLGEKTGMSPIKINYLLDQYSGGVGDILLPLGTPQAENNVIEDKFTTDSTMKSKYPGEFFSKVDELEINSNSSKATDEDILKYKYISSVSSDIGKLYAEKRDIQNSDATDEKKKSQLKEVQKQINKLAKNSLENIDKVTKGDKYAQIDKNQYYKDVEGEWQKVTDKDKEKNKKSELSLKTYSSYKYQMSKVKQQKVNKGEMTKDQSLKNDDKIQILLDSNYSDKEKSAIYENYIKTQTKKGEYDSFDVIKASSIDIDEYLKFEQQDFTSDKKDDGTLDGKTVSKSKQKKVVQYLNSMKIDGNQRLLLYAMQGYTINSSQKSQLAQYVYNLKLNKDTKLELYNKFSGFKVYKDGRVQW